LVARAPATTMRHGFEAPFAPFVPTNGPRTKFVCSRGSKVADPEGMDEVVGACRVDELAVRPHLLNDASSFLDVVEITWPSGEDHLQLSDVIVRAGGAVVAAIRSPSAPRRLKLNARGRALLHRSRRLTVHVEAQSQFVGHGPELQFSFVTLLSLRR